MQARGRFWVGGLLVAAVLVGGVTTSWADAVTLKLKYPIGRKARYKNDYSFDYFSNRAELIILSSNGGTMRVSVYGEWKSTEEVVPPVAASGEKMPPGTAAIRATLSDGSNRAVYLGATLTAEQYPYTLDLLNKHSFTWRITPDAQVTKFNPAFEAYKIERIDLITDLFQYWMPNITPKLPDKPVSEGDSWKGESRVERPFSSMDMMGRSALVDLKSTYRVKSIKQHKKRTEVTISEDGVADCQGWVDVSAASLYYSGKGTLSGEWVIDATHGIVLERKLHIDIDMPTVIKAGEKEPVADIHAEVKIDLSRKLDKLEHE